MNWWLKLKQLMPGSSPDPAPQDPQSKLQELAEQLQHKKRESRRRLFVALTQRHQLAEQLDRLRARIDGWDEKARQALSWGEEQLAKDALVHKTECETEYKSQIAELETQLEGYKKQIAAERQLQKHLEAALRRKDTLLAQLRQAQTRYHLAEELSQDQQEAAYGEIAEFEQSLDALHNQVAELDELGDLMPQPPGSPTSQTEPEPGEPSISPTQQRTVQKLDRKLVPEPDAEEKH